MFKNIHKIHFVGIGGIGMSGIAEILLDQGFEVSGSDNSLSEITDRLTKLGAKVYKGHSPENLKEADVLVYSSAVTTDNPEVAAAIEKNIPVIKRSEMLAETMRMKYGIGIAGTHGKTTTTSMVGLCLTEGGIDPTIIVGGKLSGLGGTNARLGNGEFIVVEADEFDRTFLKLTPVIAALTTLESEHLDTYKDLDDIKSAFIEFANKVPFYGFVVLCLDEPALLEIIPEINKKIITYGTTPHADIRAVDITHNEFSSTFTVKHNGEDLGKIKLNVPGLYNVKNSLVAVTIAKELGIGFSVIKKALEMELPILGICRGEQILNVYMGGSLYVDIPSDYDTSIYHRCPDFDTCFHLIRVKSESLLNKICNINSCLVNSSHHQAVNRLADGFEVIARGEDGLVESIAWSDPENHPFLLGVQWHPERMDTLHHLSAPIAMEFLKEATIHQENK